ncbi:hypothetical protein V8F06_013451, partial [Rhypophila decipiens]
MSAGVTEILLFFSALTEPRLSIWLGVSTQACISCTTADIHFRSVFKGTVESRKLGRIRKYSTKVCIFPHLSFGMLKHL